MSLGGKVKDPRDSRYFTFDWTLELGDDTIDTSEFTITPAGLDVMTSGIVPGNKKTTVELSGGVSGQTYTVRNTITRVTTAETLSKSGTISVRDE